MKLTIGEIANANSRFPRLYLELDGKRYLIETVDASRLGRMLADAARASVARVDIDVLRPVVCEIEITPI